MKKVIITEKPSVGQEFAKVLDVGNKKDGYIENEEWIITWSIGHLVGMLYPQDYNEKYKQWNILDLPFLPKEYKYGVLSTVKKQYNVVHKILNRSDISVVYWAGDSGREGQVIEENIRKLSGLNKNILELRVWIDSYTKEEILKGIAEAKPMQAYINLANAGTMRAIEDYAIGINFSRALTCKYAQLINNAADLKKYTPISVGRVMTCILGMIVTREQEIRDFEQNIFYKINGIFGEDINTKWILNPDSKYYNSEEIYGNDGFINKNKAEQLIKNLNGHTALIKDYSETETKKVAPLLFNLTELQNECSRKFKISPAKTLDIVQLLYEKKLTTYPRTDARVLSTAIAKDIKKNIKGLKGGKFDKYVNKILDNGNYINIIGTKYVNDDKITDHYAIIPTGVNSYNINTLSELELKVYDIIVRRFLSIFYPSAIYKNIKIEINVENEIFIDNKKILISEGYLEVEGKSENFDNVKVYNITNIKKGDVIDLKELTIKETKTTPPQRYTSGSILLAMEHAGKLIENEELRGSAKPFQIGTSATRAGILKKLEDISYIKCDKRTQTLEPSELGEMIVCVVNETVPELLIPELTAIWDLRIEKIEKGELSVNEYMNCLEVFVKEYIEDIKNKDNTSVLIEKIKPFTNIKGELSNEKKEIILSNVKCPKCNGKIKKTRLGYICENYKKKVECNFAVNKFICEKEITDDDIERLLLNRKTNLIKGFKSKSGQKFNAYLVYEGNKVIFELADTNNVIDIKCPKCAKNLYNNKLTLDCECGFKMWKKIAGKELSAENIKQLLGKGKRTNLIKGFKSKSGKNFSAYLKLNDDFVCEFEFPDKKN